MLDFIGLMISEIDLSGYVTPFGQVHSHSSGL